jgi:hypothetical protein
MSTPQTKPLSTDCDECRKVVLEKELDAKESELDAQRTLSKLDHEHDQALDSAQKAAAIAARAAHLQSENDLNKLFHESLTEVAKEGITRSRDGAKYVQTAASAIAALYTGILGLAFSVTDKPLPIRGAAAAVFLGLAVALSTAYLAYLTKARTPPMYGGGGSLSELQLNRTGFLTRWVGAIINERRWAIRASVISLAVGVAFIPAPFVAAHRATAIPSEPAAPAIPTAVAPELGTLAKETLEKQLVSYGAAVKARNEAIGKASTETTKISSQEATANEITLVIGVIGLLAVVLGPVLIASQMDEVSEAEDEGTPVPTPAGAGAVD